VPNCLDHVLENGTNTLCFMIYIFSVWVQLNDYSLDSIESSLKEVPIYLRAPLKPKSGTQLDVAITSLSYRSIFVQELISSIAV
jgi:hypothetical protein